MSSRKHFWTAAVLVYQYLPKILVYGAVLMLLPHLWCYHCSYVGRRLTVWDSSRAQLWECLCDWCITLSVPVFLLTIHFLYPDGLCTRFTAFSACVLTGDWCVFTWEHLPLCPWWQPQFGCFPWHLQFSTRFHAWGGGGLAGSTWFIPAYYY